MGRPTCPICMEEYNESTIRPHVIPECLHSMCLSCCKKSGRCGTCNSAYSRSADFKVSTDVETLHRENCTLRRIQNKEIELTARQLEDLFVSDDDDSIPPPNTVFRIYVRNYAGKSVPIDVKSEQTVAMLKQDIKIANHTPIADQLLQFGGKIMEDHKTIGYYGLKRGDTLPLGAPSLGGLVKTKFFLGFR